MNNLTSQTAYAGLPGDGSPDAVTTRPDNFSIMLFLAALFHGVLILGVSFSAGKLASKSADAESMEVVLLKREYEKRPEPSDAEYLAQQNLSGFGNTAEEESLRVAYGRNSNPAMPGPEREGADKQRQQIAEQSDAQHLLYARVPNAGAIGENQRTEQTTNAAAVRTGMPGTANSVEILATPDMETVLQGVMPRQMLVSANTRESRVAAYLDSWKRRVERVGTINFPYEELGKPGITDPVLEVSIAADGKLSEVIILRGSGSRELDMAAVNILKTAAPFDRFPEYLRNDYDVLKFSYEWRFTGNSVGRMTVP